MNTTPVIEIAGDGKTAQGAWYSAGVGVMPTYSGDNIQLRAAAYHSKYGADFVFEHDEWKLWHLQVAFDFAPPLPRDTAERLAPTSMPSSQLFVDPPSTRNTPGKLPPLALPAAHRYHSYDLGRRPEIWPPLPRTYERFSDVISNCNHPFEMPRELG